MKLVDYVQSLRRSFRLSARPEAAHASVGPLLRELASDDLALREALALHLLDPRRVGRPSHPALLLELERDTELVLGLNLFFPRADGRTDVAWNGVHHHGDLWLTSVVAHGPGYGYTMLSEPEPIAGSAPRVRCGLLRDGHHAMGTPMTVAARQPHAVFAPASFTATIAVWSPERRSVLDRIKRAEVLRGHERRLRDAATRLGLARALRLRLPAGHDLEVLDDGFLPMAQRIDFRPGPGAERALGLCQAAQSMSPSLREEIAYRGLHRDPSLAADVRAVLERFVRGERLEHRVARPGFAHVPHMNVDRRRVLAAAGS